MGSRRNAVIMAAGMSSRFVPLSSEKPKGLLKVKGEILIERQIRQLLEAGIGDITVVTGYMADKFAYLSDKFGVSLVHNPDYERYNNTSSVIRVLDRLANTFLCSSDNYFLQNVFADNPGQSYYSALYAEGPTAEYCISTDGKDAITGVSIGGNDSWYMIGHVYLDADFGSKFANILEKEYRQAETRQQYWEDVYIRHLRELPPMKIRRYKDGEIAEFDTLDELRLFDKSYITDTRSSVIKAISRRLGVEESELHDFRKREIPGSFSFEAPDGKYFWNPENETIEKQ